MKAYSAVNEILVGLFKNIIEIEEKSIISDEFKDVTVNDMHIIEAIGVDDANNMSTIANKLKVTVGTLTIAINNLVKKGYVLRSRGEKDRRVVFISLSPKGVKAFRHHEKFHREMTSKVVEGLTDNEIEVLLRALGNISSYFKL